MTISDNSKIDLPIKSPFKFLKSSISTTSILKIYLVSKTKLTFKEVTKSGFKLFLITSVDPIIFQSSLLINWLKVNLGSLYPIISLFIKFLQLKNISNSS